MQPLDAFLDAPTLAGLTMPDDARYDPDFELRLGVLLGAGLISAGEVRLLYRRRFDDPAADPLPVDMPDDWYSPRAGRRS